MYVPDHAELGPDPYRDQVHKRCRGVAALVPDFQGLYFNFECEIIYGPSKSSGPGVRCYSAKEVEAIENLERGLMQGLSYKYLSGLVALLEFALKLTEDSGDDDDRVSPGKDENQLSGQAMVGGAATISHSESSP